MQPDQIVMLRLFTRFTASREPMRMMRACCSGSFQHCCVMWQDDLLLLLEGIINLDMRIGTYRSTRT